MQKLVMSLSTVIQMIQYVKICYIAANLTLWLYLFINLILFTFVYLEAWSSRKQPPSTSSTFFSALASVYQVHNRMYSVGNLFTNLR